MLPWRWINKWTCSNFCTLMRTFVQFSSLCLKASCAIQDSILHFWRPEHGEQRYRNTIHFTSQPPAHFSTNMEQSRLRQNFNSWLNIPLISRKHYVWPTLCCSEKSFLTELLSANRHCTTQKNELWRREVIEKSVKWSFMSLYGDLKRVWIALYLQRPSLTVG